jgi:hypothetical protein
MGSYTHLFGSWYHHTMVPSDLGIFYAGEVVCQNSLNASLSQTRNKVCLKNTQNVNERFVETATMMGIHSDYLDKLEQAFNLLHDKKVSDQDVKYIINSLV